MITETGDNPRTLPSGGRHLSTTLPHTTKICPRKFTPCFSFYHQQCGVLKALPQSRHLVSCPVKGSSTGGNPTEWVFIQNDNFLRKYSHAQTRKTPFAYTLLSFSLQSCHLFNHIDSLNQFGMSSKIEFSFLGGKQKSYFEFVDFEFCFFGFTQLFAETDMQ